MKEDIIVLGRGGHAKVVIDIIEKQGKYNIIGITDKEPSYDEKFMGYPILGNDDVLKKYYESGHRNLAIGVGGFKNNNQRTYIFDEMKSKGFYLPSIVHPSAIISKNVVLSEGAVICPNVVLSPCVRIGMNTILGIGTLVDHETELGDNVLTGTGVVIGAYSKINRGTVCALGSNVISGIIIGEDILVGAGAVVINNLVEKGIYMGIPAKKR